MLAFPLIMEAAYIFRSTQDIPGFFDVLFGGLFLAKGIPLVFQLGILVFLPLAIFFSAAHDSSPKRFFLCASRCCSLLSFALIGLHLLQPWDELFVNLRHSVHWAESNRFSFNLQSNLEGTIDFLPYFLIGCLGKLGLPFIDLAFLFSFAGGLLCLWVGVKLMKHWHIGKADTWGLLILTLYAPLLFNSSHGFTATLFTANILWSIYFLFHASRWKTAFFLLSMIPLVRLEGLLLVVLFLSLYAFEPFLVQGTPLKARFRNGACLLVFLPAVLLSWIRHHFFGSFLPLPVQYKSSMGSLFYFLIGMRNLAADLVACYGLLTILVLILILLWLKEKHSPLTEMTSRTSGAWKCFGPLICLAIFSVPYYFSGGDWFPSYWGRYLLPFCLYAIILTGTLVTLAYPLLTALQRKTLLAATVGVFVLQSLWPISSYWKLFDRTFSRRKTMAILHTRQAGRGHYRIQHLSQLGNHLGKTTEKSDVIASSEVATIMYFAKRETLDLLGIVNPEIIKMPLREMPGLIRRFPYRSELPYLIFKRINANLVKKHQPEIVFTFDFILRDMLKDMSVDELPTSEITDSLIFVALRRWHHELKGLIDPLYHGLEELERLEYRPVVVLYENGFCGMYFVSPKALQGHLQKLRENGFTGGWAQNPSVNNAKLER